MPRLCKPTKEAIQARVDAYMRLTRIIGAGYYEHYPVPIEVFGLKETQKKGELSMDDMINELRIANSYETLH